MESLIQRRPFLDGNKRTGTPSAVYSLRRHGYWLEGVTNAQLVELSLAVAAHQMGTGELSLWFEEHAEAL
jgi:prophage maintenance system killer protein